MQCCKAGRKVGNVIVEPVAVIGITNAVVQGIFTTLLVVIGTALMAAKETSLLIAAVGFFAVGALNLASIECVYQYAFENYNVVDEGKRPWFFWPVANPILLCDAVVLLQHRLVRLQRLSEKAQEIGRKNKWPSDLFQMVRVDLDSMRARLSPRLEFDLRTGKMYLDGAENNLFEPERISEQARHAPELHEELKEPLLVAE